MSGCEILFEGSKLFPKVRKTLNVSLIEHTIIDVIEVILTNDPCPEPTESRIYIDTEILDLKVGLVNKDGERKNFDPSCNHKIVQKKVKYIVDRLQATSYSEEKKLIEFCMQFTFVDRDEDFESGVDADSMVIERPDALFPYKRNQLQYILSDKCPTEASFSSGPGVSGHRDSLAVTRHYQKPMHPRSMIPATTFSGAGNAAIKRAHSDLGAAAQPRSLSGLLPRMLGLGKGVTITHITATELPSPSKTASSTSSGYDSPSREAGSSKKEGTLLSLTSILWTSVSALGNSLKLSRSQKVVPGNTSESSCKDDHSGFERASGKTDESYLASPNHSPLPSQRVGLAPQ